MALTIVTAGCVCIDGVASLEVTGKIVDRDLQPLTDTPVEIRLLDGGDPVRPSPIQTTSTAQGDIEAASGYSLYGGTVPFCFVWLPDRPPPPPAFDAIEVSASIPGGCRQISVPLKPGMLLRTDNGGRLELGVVTLEDSARE